ncbi:hypothetical protein BJY16_004192 [Actinoplanes octamycinicus]|uniref:Uncharacterized protein n=1 Tax=Actinoplanes octamycinicus TaxID=135948 RepID=A0A7W7M8B4_9ACTN|nr:hypothetical protein [Actinoplanes octamycinicus]MBB4740733.1 hypothetical protein [Actinoplanes octamycinicus]
MTTERPVSVGSRWLARLLAHRGVAMPAEVTPEELRRLAAVPGWPAADAASCPQRMATVVDPGRSATT